MARRKAIKEVETQEIEVSVDPVEIEIDVQEKVDDALLLKVDHTHAGVFYKKGTSVTELNPSEATLAFMKKRDMV